MGNVGIMNRRVLGLLVCIVRNVMYFRILFVDTIDGVFHEWLVGRTVGRSHFVCLFGILHSL